MPPPTLQQDGPDTALARLLLASGRLPIDVLRAELEAARRGGPDLAARLVSAGHLSAREVDELIRAPSQADSAEVRRVDVLLSGFALDRFELLGELGRGGMGVVYRARDTLLDREVAIKCLQLGLGDDPVELERFRREAQTLAQLQHPGLARVHEVVPQSALGTCIVMDFVPGQTLADRLEAGPLPLAEAAEVVLAVCEAVAHAHAHGVIHRDLKPANLMLRPDGQVVVLDFGLARKIVEDSRLTQAGEVVGTPAFMAPEQILARPLDERTDVYALGAILYTAVRGEQPFQGHGAIQVFSQVLESPAPALLEAPLAVAEVVARCLRKDPDERFPSVRRLAAALRQALAAPPPPPPPARSRAWLALPLAVAALGGLAWALRAPTPAPAPPPEATPAPASPTPLPQLVEALERAAAGDDPTRTIGLARAVLARDPRRVAAHLHLVAALRAAGRLDEALAAADRALDGPARGHLALRVERAAVHHAAGRDREAVAEINRVVGPSGKHPRARELRGWCYARLGEHRRALPDLTYALQTRARFRSYAARADVHLHLELFDEARADLAAAARLATGPEQTARLAALRARLERSRR